MSGFQDIFLKYKEAVQKWAVYFRESFDQMGHQMGVWSKEVLQNIKASFASFSKRVAEFPEFLSRTLQSSKELFARWAEQGYQMASKSVQNVVYYAQKGIEFVTSLPQNFNQAFWWCWDKLARGFLWGYHFIIDNVKNLYQLGMQLAKGLKKLVLETWNQFKLIPNAIKRVISFTLTQIKQLGYSLKNALEQGLKWALNHIKAFPRKLMKALEYTWDFLKQFGHTLKVAIEQSLKWAWKNLKELPSQVIKALDVTWNVLKQAVYEFKNIIEQGLKFAWKNLKELPSQVMKALDVTWNFLKQAVYEFKNSLEQGLKLAWHFIKSLPEKLGQIFDFCVKSIKGIGQALSSFCRSFYQALSHWVPKALQIVRTNLQALWLKAQNLVEILSHGVKFIFEGALYRTAALFGLIYGVASLITDGLAQFVPNLVKTGFEQFIALDTLHFGSTLMIAAGLVAGASYSVYKAFKFGYERMLGVNGLQPLEPEVPANEKSANKKPSATPKAAKEDDTQKTGFTPMYQQSREQSNDSDESQPYQTLRRSPRLNRANL